MSFSFLPSFLNPIGSVSVFGLYGAYWPQDKLNDLLSGNNAGNVHFPKISDVGMMGSFAMAYQYKKYRFVYGYEFMVKRNHDDNYKLEERLGAWVMNVQYPIYRTKALGISPEVGLGMMKKRFDIYANDVPNNLGTVMASRNAVNLFSHLYYLNLAMNVGLAYDEDMKDHWLQLMVGYKYCFAGTDWSSDDSKQTLSVSNHDYLRMAYVGLKINGFRIK